MVKAAFLLTTLLVVFSTAPLSKASDEDHTFSINLKGFELDEDAGLNFDDGWGEDDHEEEEWEDDEVDVPPSYCSVARDVLFIFESSSQTKADSFFSTKTFIHEVVAGLDIASDLTRVGVSWTNSDEVFFNNFNKEQIMQMINSAPYVMGDAQPDGKAIDVANTFHLRARNGWRGNKAVPTIVVMLNDRVGVRRQKSSNYKLPGLRTRVARIIAIGVGDEAHRGRLQEDATNDADAILLTNHYDLMGQIQPVLDKICN